MNNQRKSINLLLLFGLFLAAPVAWLPARAADVSPAAKPKIYDETLDGAKQIADATATAKRDNKRVLLQFGANWCGWCHKLHRLFDTDPAVSAELKAAFVVVMVDVDKGHNQSLVTRYGVEHFGLPSLVVVDADGKHLTSKNTGELEEGDHHSPDKVLAFLKTWAKP